MNGKAYADIFSESRGPSPLMTPDRRHFKREILGQSSYIHIASISGGIVLNASESGLAFQAVAPVMQSGPLRFTVSPFPEERIDLIGEIVWLDKSRKHGGLHFIELSEDSLTKVRDWLTQSAGLRFPCESHAPSTLGVATPIEQLKDKKDDPNFPAPSLNPSPQPPPIRPVPGFLQRSPKKNFYSPLLYVISQWLHRFGAKLLFCAFAMTSLFLAHSFRARLGDSFIRFGEKIKGQTSLESHSANMIPSTNQTAMNSTFSGPSPLVASESRVPSNSTPPVSNQTMASISTPSAEHLLVSESSPHRHPHPVSNRSALAIHLWSAVGTGDDSAAILLAELYVTGQGVPKSCEQARVLLKAAAKKGNEDALQRLRTLGKTNCR